MSDHNSENMFLIYNVVLLKIDFASISIYKKMVANYLTNNNINYLHESGYSGMEDLI